MDRVSLPQLFFDSRRYSPHQRGEFRKRGSAMPKNPLIEFSCRLSRDDNQKAVVQVNETVEDMASTVRRNAPEVFHTAFLYGLRVYVQNAARKVARDSSDNPTVEDLKIALHGAIEDVGLTPTTANVATVSRLSAEIAAFRRLSADEQRALLAILAERRKQAETDANDSAADSDSADDVS